MDGSSLPDVVNATGNLAETFSKHEVWGVIAFFAVLLVFQFVVFMLKLRSREREAQRDRNSYGKLLEGRHDQFIGILQRAIEAINAAAQSDERLRAKLRMIEEDLKDVAEYVQRQKNKPEGS